MRKKQKSLCVLSLPRPVHVSVSVKSTHPCRAKFQVIFPPQPLSLLAFKVPVFYAGLLGPSARSGCTEVLQDQVTKGCRLIGVCAEVSV